MLSNSSSNQIVLNRMVPLRLHTAAHNATEIYWIFDRGRLAHLMINRMIAHGEMNVNQYIFCGP